MISLKDIDSSKLLFDIHSATFVDDIKATIPEFQEYKGKVPEKKVFLYLVLICDKNSPMFKEIPDYFNRKYVTANMCGFPKTKAGFSEDAEKVILGGNESVNDMLVAYLVYHGIPNYMSLFAYIALNANETRKIMGGSGNKDSIKVIDETTDRIAKLTREVFGSGAYDEYSALKEALYSRVEKERLRLRPEQIIADLEKMGALDPSFCPYGEENAVRTAVNEMFFIGDK